MAELIKTGKLLIPQLINENSPSNAKIDHSSYSSLVTIPVSIDEYELISVTGDDIHQFRFNVRDENGKMFSFGSSPTLSERQILQSDRIRVKTFVLIKFDYDDSMNDVERQLELLRNQDYQNLKHKIFTYDVLAVFDSSQTENSRNSFFKKLFSNRKTKRA